MTLFAGFARVGCGGIGRVYMGACARVNFCVYVCSAVTERTAWSDRSWRSLFQHASLPAPQNRANLKCCAERQIPHYERWVTKACNDEGPTKWRKCGVREAGQVAFHDFACFAGVGRVFSHGPPGCSERGASRQHGRPGCECRGCRWWFGGWTPAPRHYDASEPRAS